MIAPYALFTGLLNKTNGAKHALLKTAALIVPHNVDELASQYSRISVPVLILWGAYDRIVPHAIGDRLARMIQAQLVTLEGSGHAPQEELPQKTLGAISSFLK